MQFNLIVIQLQIRNSPKNQKVYFDVETVLVKHSCDKSSWKGLGPLAIEPARNTRES